MTEDRWETYDLPVLQAIARLEERDDSNFGLVDLARETGFEVPIVKQSLRRIENAYVTFTAMSGDGDPLLSVRNIRLLPDGRRVTKQWPTPQVSQIPPTFATWIAEFRPALELAFQEFLASAEWPEREWFRRKLVQRKLDHLSLDRVLHEMPRSWWEPRSILQERVVLSLQVLQELPEARRLLEVSLAIVQRAYELYSSEDDTDPELVIRSSDPARLSAALGDAQLLLCAREILGQHVPHPLGGGTADTGSTEWTKTLNVAAMPSFKDVATIGDDLVAQEHIITEERERYGGSPMAPRATQPAFGGTPTPDPQVPVDVLVVMPFREKWSDGVYAFIRRSLTHLGAPWGAINLYRADQIAAPGEIPDQIKRAIEDAHVVVADITDVNPNVMWELGYADGLRRTAVVLNQKPDSSPFNIAGRRQVSYRASPTEENEVLLARYLREALLAALGEPQPTWLLPRAE